MISISEHKIKSPSRYDGICERELHVLKSAFMKFERFGVDELAAAISASFDSV